MTNPSPAVHTGQIVWVNLSPTAGKEQAGHRPAVVVSSTLFLQVVTDLVTVIPVTSTNRGWANHVPVPILGPDSVAMTEQIRTISRSRITKYGSCVDEESLDNMRMWIRDFLI